MYLTPQNVRDIADWCNGYVKYDSVGSLSLWYHSDNEHLRINGPDVFDRVAPFGSWIVHDPVKETWDWMSSHNFSNEFLPCPKDVTDDIVSSLAVQVNKIRNDHADDPDLDAVIVGHVLAAVGGVL